VYHRKSLSRSPFPVSNSFYLHQLLRPLRAERQSVRADHVFLSTTLPLLTSPYPFARFDTADPHWGATLFVLASFLQKPSRRPENLPFLPLPVTFFISSIVHFDLVSHPPFPHGRLSSNMTQFPCVSRDRRPRSPCNPAPCESNFNPSLTRGDSTVQSFNFFSPS